MNKKLLNKSFELLCDNSANEQFRQQAEVIQDPKLKESAMMAYEHRQKELYSLNMQLASEILNEGNKPFIVRLLERVMEGLKPS